MGNLYAYYNDADKYTEQLRKLEKTVADVPNSAPGHFLLGYHYLMTGAKEEAKTHFAQAAKLTPNDKLAQHILKQLESGNAVTPPDLPKRRRPANKRASCYRAARNVTTEARKDLKVCKGRQDTSPEISSLQSFVFFVRGAPTAFSVAPADCRHRACESGA